jgi:PIN domain nuclease of toxin-antitoxin system
VIVADTHAWLWWLSGDPSLSARARAALDGAFEDAALGVSAISVWEVAMLVKKGRLALALPLDDLVAHCETLVGLRFLSVTPRIALASVALEPLHADPADRLIAATALAHGASLVTKDERLHAVAGLASLW